MATVTGTKRLLDITGDNITTAVSLEAEGTLLDSNGTSGTSGQLLSSTGTGVDWVSNNSGSWDGIYSGSAQITGSLGVTGSIFIKGETEIFDFNNTAGDTVSFRGDQVGITKADDSIYASFGIGAGGQFTFQNPNLIVLGDDEGIDTGMILELDMTAPSMALNGGTYFQSFGSGGDLWTVHDTDLGIRTKIESDGLGSDNSFWQKGGSNTNYSHVIGYEFGTNNDLKIGFDNCYNIDLFPTNLVNLKNGKLSVFRGTTFTSTIFLGGNSDGGGTGVNFQYSPSGIFQINDSNMGEGFFQKGSSTIDIKIGDYNGVINETYIEIDDTNAKVIIPNGNVGIGTTSPSTTLEVGLGLSSGFDGIFVKGEFAGGTSFVASKNPFLSLGTSTSAGYTSTIYLGASATATDQDSKIEFNKSNNALSIYYKGQGTYREHVRFGDPSSSTPKSIFFGNVGIGTTSPATKLDVAGTYRQLNPAAGAAGGTVIARTLTYTVSPYGLVTRAYANGLFTIQCERESNAGETFDLALQPTGGNLGIGTTSPSQKLHVVGRAIVEDRLAIGGDFVPQKALHLKNAAPVFRFEDSDITGGYLDMIKTSRNMKFDLEPTDALSSTNFDFKIGGTTHLYMKNSQVGIMNDSPTEALDITGNVQAETLIATDLTDGYVPYSKSGTLGLQDSKIYTQGAGIGVGTTTLAAGCHITSLSDISATGYRVSAMQTAPATRNSTGTLGEIRITSNYIYVCYATDSWSRVALATSW